MKDNIIIVMNPVEAAVWEALQSGIGFPIFVGLIVFVASFVICSKVWQMYAPFKMQRNRITTNRRDEPVGLWFAIAGALFCLTIYVMI